MSIFFNTRILLLSTLFVNFTKSSKIYVIDVPDQQDDDPELLTSNEKPNNNKGNTYFDKLYSRYSYKKDLPENAIVKKLLAINEPKKNKRDNIITKNICNGHFESIYSTNMHKVRCTEDLNGKKYERTQLLRFKVPKYYGNEVVIKPRKHKYPLFNYYGRYLKADLEPFVDLTRQEIKPFSNDYLDVRDLARTDFEDKPFSNDYLDVGDLVRASQDSNTYDDKQRENCYRRNAGGNTDLKKKTVAEYLKVRAHSDETESETSEEIKMYKPKKSYKKPKNFEVEDNASSESDSVEDEPPEKNYKNKNKRDNKYGVLQGGNNRFYFDTDFDADTRKRLEHFLPKRYHWEEDEIQDLGYFWFNGPRGKYPEPLRTI